MIRSPEVNKSESSRRDNILVHAIRPSAARTNDWVMSNHDRSALVADSAYEEETPLQS